MYCIYKRELYSEINCQEQFVITYNIDVFGPLPATMGDIPNRPKMTTKN